jgi:hypothetical protein
VSYVHGETVRLPSSAILSFRDHFERLKLQTAQPQFLAALHAAHQIATSSTTTPTAGTVPAARPQPPTNVMNAAAAAPAVAPVHRQPIPPFYPPQPTAAPPTVSEPAAGQTPVIGNGGSAPVPAAAAAGPAAPSAMHLSVRPAPAKAPLSKFHYSPLKPNEVRARPPQ